jgi:4-hydroxy-tetrahydrodipicolinate synthase
LSAPFSEINTTLARGSICALITPFSAAGEIDWAALKALIEAQIAGGTDALVIAGSTGESVALTEAEFSALVTESVKIAGQRIGIIAGTGTPSTARTQALGAIAAEAGAQAALVVTPAYCRPTQDGLFRHFQRVADSSALPVILYNVPARTAVDLWPETVARLCGHKNIIGIKEALPDMARMQQLLTLQDAHFAVLSGDDPTAAQAIALGARGLISVAANPIPAQMKALVTAALTAKSDAVAALMAILNPLFDALGLEPNPIPVKWAMHYLKLCRADLRLPLSEFSATHHATLATALDSCLPSVFASNASSHSHRI